MKSTIKLTESNTNNKLICIVNNILYFQTDTLDNNKTTCTFIKLSNNYGKYVIETKEYIEKLINS